MFDDSPEIVIVGTTAAGHAFRPSDWAERLCGMMSIFGEDRHLSYSPYLKPVLAGGVRCVVVNPRARAARSRRLWLLARLRA
jgi:hypothetical protein